ncbi:MAG: hypothetical protein ACO3PC_07645 [Steroidobacteraceae bacterium]|jgi:hypothetical protein
MVLSLLLIGCSPRSPQPQGPKQGVAAEIRDDVAYVPGTQQRYTGPLTTYYWSGEYVKATYIDGRLHGTWTRYSREAEVLMHVCFENGNPIECRD